MSNYPPPAGNAVNFVLVDNYVPPVGNAVNFTLAAPVTPTVEVSFALEQPYGDLLISIAVVFDQPYGISDTQVVKLLDQIHGLSLHGSLNQYYESQPVLTSLIDQYYRSNFIVTRSMDQIFTDSARVVSFVNEPYGLSKNLAALLSQQYCVSGGSVFNAVFGFYDLSLYNPLNNFVVQNYNIFSQGREVSDSSSVTVGGVPVRCSKIDLRYSQSAYVARGSLTLVDYKSWQDVVDKAPVVITVNGESYHLIVIAKTKSETFQNRDLQLEITSPAVLLSFPYAGEILDDSSIEGKMSQIVNNLAALEGLSISWEIPVDDVLTVNEVQAKGKEPIEVIREIINPLGGLIQSLPDGSIHAVPRYIVNTDKFTTAVTVKDFTTGEDFVSLEEVTEKRDGFNKYSIGSTSSSDGWEFDTEKINSSTYKLKAFRVPWVSVSPNVYTSELTNVTITPFSLPVIEELEEEIEIVTGSGTVSKPCYELTSVNYKTSRDLGNVTVGEDKVVTTEVIGNTLVTIKYKTKYWAWTVYDPDKENVQFILEA